MAHAKRCETCCYWEQTHNGIGYCWNVDGRYIGEMTLWDSRRVCWKAKEDEGRTGLTFLCNTEEKEGEG